jgi:hypothetical protein
VCLAQEDWWTWFNVVLLPTLYAQTPDQSTGRMANGFAYSGDLRFSPVRVRQVTRCLNNRSMTVTVTVTVTMTVTVTVTVTVT